MRIGVLLLQPKEPHKELREEPLETLPLILRKTTALEHLDCELTVFKLETHYCSNDGISDTLLGQP